MHLLYFYSHFLLYVHSDLSDYLRKNFDNFWLSLADKFTTGTYNFVYLKVKIILRALSSLLISFSLPAPEKTQYFVHLSFNSTLQLINGISSDIQKLLKCFNGIADIAFLKIPSAAFDAGWAAVFSNNLAFYWKDLKLSVFAILSLKLDASS